MSVLDGVAAHRMSSHDLRTWYRGYRVLWKQTGHEGEPPHPSTVPSQGEVQEWEAWQRPVIQARCLVCGSAAWSDRVMSDCRDRLIRCQEPTCRKKYVMRGGSKVELDDWWVRFSGYKQVGEHWEAR